MSEENIPTQLTGLRGELPFGRTIELAAQKQVGSKTIDQLTPQDRARPAAAGQGAVPTCLATQGN